MNNNHHQPYTADTGAAQVASQPATPCQQIKLALDVHAATIVVVRMVDGAKPQPPQTMKPASFLEWVQKQKAHAQEVVSCYEAGPTGFWLHRRLTALGVRNYVVCPTRLDERHRGVANDRTDALELATRLDRFLTGNDTTKRDGGDRPRPTAARFPSFQLHKESDATNPEETQNPTDRHN